MNSFTVLWEAALKKLDTYFYLNNNGTAFNTYIKTLSPQFEENGRYIFRVPNVHHQELAGRFLRQIADAMKEAYRESYGQERAVEILILTGQELDNMLLEKKPQRQNFGDISLNHNYTFDTFVVGSSNNLAHAASRAVANAPGLAYNPLFIYGGVGLGKTHLMHAIGNRILENNPDAKIIYITTEAFTNEFIESIQKHTTEAFRNKFRKVDVLMIDDIQFISKAQGTQEELFHTFNTLREASKQIVLSSDKPPSEIPKLEERLLSRFQWGLLTDIGLPDYETRVAILKQKAPYIKEIIRCNLEIDDAVLNYIASKEDTNIRDLEGALTKVIASAQLENGISSITLPIAEKALSTFFLGGPTVKAITPKQIISQVCEYYDISEEDIRSKKKSREIAFPRQVAMYLLKHMTDLTFQAIGEMLGVTNHTTVVYGVRKITEAIASSAELSSTVDDITQKIKDV